MASHHPPVTAAEVLMSSYQQPFPVPRGPTRNWSPTLETAVSRANASTSVAEADPNYESMPQSSPGIFPCLHPINPHMRDSENRLQTFADRAANWPAHRINATPREIVEAGFYYLGQSIKIFLGFI